MAKREYVLDELNIDEVPAVEEMIFFENRRKQHLHLIVAQILGLIAGIALVWAAYKSSDNVPMREIVAYLLIFPFYFLVLFRASVRVFQKFRMLLGRRVYDAATGQQYIAPRNILAGFISYATAVFLVSFVSYFIAITAELVSASEGITVVFLWIEVGCATAMLFLTTVYLLYRDIDYVRTAGVGSVPDKLRKGYLFTMLALALVIAIIVIF